MSYADDEASDDNDLGDEEDEPEDGYYQHAIKTRIHEIERLKKSQSLTSARKPGARKRIPEESDEDENGHQNDPEDDNTNEVARDDQKTDKSDPADSDSDSDAHMYAAMRDEPADLDEAQEQPAVNAEMQSSAAGVYDMEVDDDVAAAVDDSASSADETEREAKRPPLASSLADESGDEKEHKSDDPPPEIPLSANRQEAPANLKKRKVASLTSRDEATADRAKQDKRRKVLKTRASRLPIEDSEIARILDEAKQSGSRSRGGAGRERKQKPKPPDQNLLPGQPLSDEQWQEIDAEEEEDEEETGGIKYPHFCFMCECKRGTQQARDDPHTLDIDKYYRTNYASVDRKTLGKRVQEMYNRECRPHIVHDILRQPWRRRVIDAHYHEHVKDQSIILDHTVSDLTLFMDALTRTMLVPDSRGSGQEVVDLRKANIYLRFCKERREVLAELVKCRANSST